MTVMKQAIKIIKSSKIDPQKAIQIKSKMIDGMLFTVYNVIYINKVYN